MIQVIANDCMVSIPLFGYFGQASVVCSNILLENLLGKILVGGAAPFFICCRMISFLMKQGEMQIQTFNLVIAL